MGPETQMMIDQAPDDSGLSTKLIGRLYFMLVAAGAGLLTAVVSYLLRIAAPDRNSLLISLADGGLYLASAVLVVAIAAVGMVIMQIKADAKAAEMNRVQRAKATEESRAKAQGIIEHAEHDLAPASMMAPEGA